MDKPMTLDVELLQIEELEARFEMIAAAIAAPDKDKCRPTIVCCGSC